MVHFYLNLFIFASEYSVHQLRDDIMTAMVGQSQSWDCFPELSEDLLATAYDNLSSSAMFLSLLVLSAAQCWLTQYDEDCVARLCSLRERNSEYAFEVSKEQAQIVQKWHHDEVYADGFKEDDWSACTMHEHLVMDKDQCWARIRNKTHVFAEPIDACAKDRVSMAQEQEEK